MTRLSVDGWLCDMDGVLIQDERQIPGADRFIARLRERARPFRIITNNPLYEPHEIVDRLASMGLEVGPDELWTSAMAAAQYVAAKWPGGRVHAMGRPAVTSALVAAGLTLDDSNPDVVVMGETRDYVFAEFTEVIRCVSQGAAFVTTNPEVRSESIHGPLPGCGAMAALVTAVTGVEPYVAGKPNPAMVLAGVAALGTEPQRTVLVGDRLDVDVEGGAAAGLVTVLCLSGSATPEEVDRARVRPDLVVDSVADLVADV